MQYLGILTKQADNNPVEKRPMSEHAKAANSIKKELKQKFPGINFKVKSSSFSGGNSVDVAWDFGPTSEEVNKLLYKYEYGTFDGMTDSYDYKNDPKLEAFQKENGSAKYVHGQRGYGPTPGHDWFNNSIYGQIGKDLCKLQHVEYDGEYTRFVYGKNDDIIVSPGKTFVICS